MSDDILTFKTKDTRWLSNMSYVDVEYDGIIYPSTENFYQAMKYHREDMVNNLTTKRKYISYLKPYEAKKFSRENTMTSLVFESKKLEIMLYAQQQKFSKEPFKTKLLLTGNCHIEEGNWWGDKFWGVDIKTRIGDNNLGKIIMKVREELRTHDN